MLTNEIKNTIISSVLQYWIEEIKKPEIVEIAKGKEIGHKLADMVDEKTTALLTINYLTKYQRDSRGQKRSRVWVIYGYMIKAFIIQ